MNIMILNLIMIIQKNNIYNNIDNMDESCEFNSVAPTSYHLSLTPDIIGNSAVSSVMPGYAELSMTGGARKRRSKRNNNRSKKRSNNRSKKRTRRNTRSKRRKNNRSKKRTRRNTPRKRTRTSRVQRIMRRNRIAKRMNIRRSRSDYD
jgi:hypothetical protein